MTVSVRIAQPAEADLELTEFRLHIAQMAGIARVENPQTPPMKSCEPLTGYILCTVAEPLVEGDVWIAAIHECARRSSQENEPKGTKRGVFHVRRPPRRRSWTLPWDRHTLMP